MIYYKKSRTVKPLRRQVDISSFAGINNSMIENLLPLKYSPLSYNYIFGNGALNTGMGFVQAEFPVLYNNSSYHESPALGVKIIGIWLYRRYSNEDEMRDDRIIVRGEDGIFYETKFFETDTFRAISNITASGKVNMANYRLNGKDVLLISSEYGKLWIYDGINEPYAAADSPAISSMCIHYERLFATTGGEKNQVWFSDDFDPANWNISMTEGGYIEFSDDLGRANKVISFLDYIYIFRDFGINRLTAYGDQNAFSMSKMFSSSGRIYPETIAICGEIVIFLADDGLYSFDGASTSRILENVNPQFYGNKEYSRACFFNGKYYLSVCLNFNDDVKLLAERETNYCNNSILEYDINTGIVNLMRGADIIDFLPININNNSMLLAVFRKTKTNNIGMFGYNGVFFDEILHKFWRTALSDLGYKGKKLIREICLYSAEDLTVGLIVDNKSYEYRVKGSKEISKIKINARGIFVSIYLKSNTAKVNIFSPSITMDII